MKASILAILALAVQTIEACEDECRERLCEPTRQKFAALKTDLQTAIKEGVNEKEAPAAPLPFSFDVEQMNVAVEKLGDHLGDRLALEVRAAIDEARAGA